MRTILLGAVLALATVGGCSNDKSSSAAAEKADDVPTVTLDETDKLLAALTKSMQAADVKKAMAFQATEIVVLGPAEFRKVVQESMVTNEKLVRSLGLTAN